MVVKNNLPGEPMPKSRSKPQYLTNARVQLVLDCSTCHVTQADTYLLDDERDDMPLVAYKYDEGYFICIPDPRSTKGVEKGLVKYGFSKEFANLVAICMNQKYDFMRLDCDGMEYKQLTKFDW